MSDKPKNRPAFILYAVKGEGEDASWSKLGAAWPHKDCNGFSLKLEMVPLNGRIVMRKAGEEGGAQ